MPFSFKFDETTTSKFRKQYDAYVQYWSKKQNLVQNRYCGSLFVGHCEKEDLEHFENFVTEMQWDKSFLLHQGMDGPNVNLAFQNRVQSYLLTQNSTFLDIGTCPLHTIYNRFSKSVRVIDFNIEQFIIDIIAFLELSAARREDYLKLEEITESSLHNFPWNIPPHGGLHWKKSPFEFLSSGKI